MHKNIPSSHVLPEALCANVIIELAIQIATFFPVVLIMMAARHGPWWMWPLALVGGFYAYSIALLLLIGLMIRMLPRPKDLGLPSRADRVRYQIIYATAALVRRTPARWLLPTPMPGGFFYLLAMRRFSLSSHIDNPDGMPDPWLVEIGRDCVIGAGAAVYAHCSGTATSLLLGLVRIGDRAVVGAGSIIWPNVEIADDAVVLSHSVVNPGARIGPGETWGGVPARCLRQRETSDDA